MTTVPESVTPEGVRSRLSSDNYGDRLTALNQLRQLDGPQALELIQPALADENVRVRYAAVSQLASLGQYDRTGAIAALRRLLSQDPEMDVKAAAADSLGALHAQEAYGDLEAVYRGTEDWLLQFSIVAALGELGNPDGFELLQEALGSGTELVRTAAVSALGELGDRRAVTLLLPLCDAEDWQLRGRVAQALGYFLEEAGVRLALEGLTQDRVEQVSQSAQSALGQAA